MDGITRLIIVSALELEQKGLHGSMTDNSNKTSPFMNLKYHEGFWNGIKINTITTGMGETNIVSRYQALLTTIHAEQGNLDGVISLFYGAGGGLVAPAALQEYLPSLTEKDFTSNRLKQDPYFVKTGDIVIIRSAIDGDADVSALPSLGHLKRGELPSDIDPQYTNRIIQTDEKISNTLFDAAIDAGFASIVKDDGYTQQTKMFVNLGYLRNHLESSVSYDKRLNAIDDMQQQRHIEEAEYFQKVTTKLCKAKLNGNGNRNDRYPNVLDMESASFLKLSELYNIPASVVRIISDYFSSNPNDFINFLNKENEISIKHIDKFIKLYSNNN
jgi:nucleoside phosphorylase